jgi:Flp pilus assembly protein TadG
MAPIRKSFQRLLSSARAFRRDRGGVAAIEFAMIFPFMLVAFFGTVEFCSAVAIDRKVTLIAKTLSDLTSQADTSLVSADLTGIFWSGNQIIKSYPGSPLTAQISEIYVDSTGKATIQWTQGATFPGGNSVTLSASTNPTRSAGQDVTSVVPAALLVKQTYLILSEVNYQYVPAVGWGMIPNTGIKLSDVSYTRPRQNACVTYNNLPAGNCPLT